MRLQLWHRFDFLAEWGHDTSLRPDSAVRREPLADAPALRVEHFTTLVHCPCEILTIDVGCA